MRAASAGGAGRQRLPWRLFAAAVLAASCAPSGSAHVLSVSQGDLRLDGPVARYELRMPLTEVPDVEDPRSELLGAFQVQSGGRSAERDAGSCRVDSEQQLFVCQTAFRFEEETRAVTVRCDYPSVTVPHHMHVLRSGAADQARQTVFDLTFREAEVRFAPPTFGELAAVQTGAGARKAITSPELLLLLVALALAARGRKELASCAGAFLGAQALVTGLASSFGWSLPLRFLEAAGALAVAYLAAEILFLPKETKRWLICGALGCFHGMFLAAFLASADMRAGFVLPGALGAEAVLAAGFGSLRLRLVRGRGEQLGALLLLVSGLAWFGLRLAP